MDDSGIVDLILAGDETAIALVREKYGARLRAIARGVLGDDGAAEECENDAYGDVIVLKTVISADKGHKKVANEYGEKYMISDFFPSIITREIFEAVQVERARRSNVIKDEAGIRRKNTHYSEKRDAPERTE